MGDSISGLPAPLYLCWRSVLRTKQVEKRKLSGNPEELCFYFDSLIVAQIFIHFKRQFRDILEKKK